MTCSACGEKPVESSKDFTKAVIEINNPESLVLLRKVVIPASMGTEEDVPPAIGKYRNVLLQYAANDHIYLYSSDGIPTSITANIPQEILDSIAELEATDVILQQEIDDIKNSPDVVDIVDTYADLQAYDTSHLGDKDIIRVLTDETHDGASSYYRWDKQTETWTYIGSIQTAANTIFYADLSETGNTRHIYKNSDMTGTVSVQELLDANEDGQVILRMSSAQTPENFNDAYLQNTYVGVDDYQFLFLDNRNYYEYDGTATTDTSYYYSKSTIQLELTAGNNITITGNTISATDTTYSAFTGATAQQAGTSGLVPAPTTSDPDKYLKGDGTWTTPPDTTYTAGTNVQISSGNVISATDTTYSNFVGTDGTAAGTAGLVPAPATTDAGKFLKADGTWDTAGGGGPTVVQTTGTSTTDVMSQNAVTSMVFNDPSTRNRICLGNGADTDSNRTVTIGSNASTYSSVSGVAVGTGASSSSASSAVAIGDGANASNYRGSVALGAGSRPSAIGEVNIGSSVTNYGYNSSNYRLLSGLYDGQSAHDAVTKGQLDGRVMQNAGAPTTSTVGTVGQLLEDTTNGKLYICTAVDTTDPQNPSYTWTEVGAGGGGPTVVQTTGTSQTDVMSQNATTSMIWGDPSTKRRISIRDIGPDSVTGEYAVGIGNASVARGEGSISIGQAATNYASGMYSVAIGNSSRTDGYSRAVALGNAANAAYDNSVAIGTNAVTTAVGEVNIGAGTSGRGYNNTNYRTLSGLHDAQGDHDAVTLGQLNGRVTQNAGAPTTSTVGTVGQLLEDTTNGKLYICTDATNPYVWTEVGAGGGGGSTITMTSTDPGEGSPLAADNYVAVYGGDPVVLDYSTSEINTGTTWVDGSTIYKKTVSIGTLPNATTKTVAHSISNFSTLIRLEGYFTNGTNSGPLPYSATTLAKNVQVYTDSTNITVGAGEDRSAYTGYVTLYYTKSS